MRKVIFLLVLAVSAQTIFATPAFAIQIIFETGPTYNYFVVGPNETVTLFAGIFGPPLSEGWNQSQWADMCLFGASLGGGGGAEVLSRTLSYDYIVDTFGKEPGYYTDAVRVRAEFTADDYIDGVWYPGAFYEYSEAFADLKIVPEPATFVLLGTGALALIRRRR
jgi:hypothetical protein